MRSKTFWIVCLFFGPNYVVFSQKDSTKSKKLLVLPVISRSIETGWSFGTVGSLTFKLSTKDSISRTSNLAAVVLYSTKKQLVTAINGAQYFNKEKYILNEQFSYSSFPDKFWGIGKNTPDSAEEPYKFNQYYVFLHLLKNIAPHFFIGLLYERQKVWDISYLSGGLMDQQNVQGRHGYLVSGIGTSVTYDSRNDAFASNKGFFGQVLFNHFDKFWGSDYNYNSIIVDLRKYFSLRKNQVIALHLLSFNNTGTEVPLRSLASFGGANSMRGYYEGRYREQDKLIIQSEYRFRIYKRLGGVAFGSIGNVSNTFANYTLNDAKYSYGGGFRFALSKKEKLNIRIDYGIGQGINNGFYLQIGEAF